jgi:hypothetical protein
MPDITHALLTAAGLSDKATKHLQAEDKNAAIAGLIKNFLEPAGAGFVEELVFRFLLTRGDALGGSMRNIGGYLAQCKLTRSIISHLRVAGRPYKWLQSETRSWLSMPDDDSSIESRLRGLTWNTNGKSRTLIYNLTVPIVRNNVDLCLFNCDSADFSKSKAKEAPSYLALGELKGGIDPAGADEHWKTAHTSLHRIREAFLSQEVEPKLFFVGAAIEAKMAAEIWVMLENGTLQNAANLTDDDQISSISGWLCHL